MFRTILILCVAAPLAPGQAPFAFEPEPQMLAKGKSPKIIARRAHGLLMTYTAAAENGSGMDLMYVSSNDLGDTFTPPMRVNRVPGEVSDHGENSPQLLSSPDDATLYAVWNGRDPKMKGGTHIRFAKSGAMMPAWSEAVTLNDDGLPVSHSFQGAAVAPDGTIYVAWLDGRDRQAATDGDPAAHAGHGITGGTSSVYLTRSSDGGKTWSPNLAVARSACPCCRVSFGFTGKRVVVTWRQAAPGDIRDIYAASSADGGATWSKPVAVSRDGWKINGCPHVGAGIASLQGKLYVTWYSEAGGKPGIYYAVSSNGGETFSPRKLLSEGTHDPTHPSIAVGEDRVAIVFDARDASKEAGWGKAAVYYREIYPDGRISPLVRAGQVKGSTKNPAAALGLSGRMFVGWTETVGGESKAYLVRGRAVSTRPAVSAAGSGQ